MKSTLEELRQRLLENQTDDKDTAGYKRSKRDMDHYLQDIREQLFLQNVLISPADLQLKERIGEGTFGVVYRGLWRGSSVAVKLIKAPVGLEEVDIVRFRREAYLMSRLRHPNIALIMGICMMQSPGPDSGLSDDTSMCIVTEYLSQGQCSH